MAASLAAPPIEPPVAAARPAAEEGVRHREAPLLNLGAAVAAVIIFLLGLGALSVTAGWASRRYVHTLAPRLFDQKTRGLVLQREAFRHPDLLPVYGSSELVWSSSYHALDFFRTYPTGFGVFAVGARGTPLLVTLQSVAATGELLRGKRVVISLSPVNFARPLDPESRDDGSYAGNFSRLHAGELVFGSSLSVPLRRRLAARLLDYPEALEPDPLLHLGARSLADNSLGGRALFAALRPLGALQTLFLHRADEWRTLQYIARIGRHAPAVRRRPRAVSWDSLVVAAEREHRENSDNNPFGVENGWWSRFGPSVLRGRKETLSDAELTRRIDGAPAWNDLVLLLAALRELGAEPLVISMPFHGVFFDAAGMTPGGRATYYDTLRRMTSEAEVRLVAFEEHDGDRWFLNDPGSHLSPKGWVFYDRAFDEFYRATAR
ncbi:MAG: D-alanyl-lipoteichoic acid biosynthesis protein DltD [Gemmatimonadota bacterium]|nr:D-alanyl-lipoteichoic acid biosynthesis protein DltD [Gemmatimonadota bacterium]